MSRLDDLDRAREEMKDALRRARHEVENNRTIVPNDLSRVELIAVSYTHLTLPTILLV